MRNEGLPVEGAQCEMQVYLLKEHSENAGLPVEGAQ